MKSIVLAVFFATIAATGAQAQAVNPDNDSAAFFAQRKSSPATPKPAQQPPRAGDVTLDGLYVFLEGERGWVHRGHRYDIAGGKLKDTDGLPHNAPKPARGGSIAIQSGPFAEHGA